MHPCTHCHQPIPATSLVCPYCFTGQRQSGRSRQDRLAGENRHYATEGSSALAAPAAAPMNDSFMADRPRPQLVLVPRAEASGVAFRLPQIAVRATPIEQAHETISRMGIPGGDIAVAMPDQQSSFQHDGLATTPHAAISLPEWPVTMADSGSEAAPHTFHAGVFRQSGALLIAAFLIVMGVFTTSSVLDHLRPSLRIPVTPTAGDSTTETINASTTARFIDAGGDGVAFFSADPFDGHQQRISTDSTIDLMQLVHPVPATTIANARFGDFSYTVTGLTASHPYRVRMYFAELRYTDSNQRVFDVFINNQRALANVDIVGLAGGPLIAIEQDVTANTDTHGTLTIHFARGMSGDATCNAVAIIDTQS